MKVIKYKESENGTRFVAVKGKEMDIIEVIAKEEFEKRFPEISTYGLEMYMPVYLDNGMVCLSNEWNGDCYIAKREDKEVHIVPVYKADDEDFQIVGYYEA